MASAFKTQLEASSYLNPGGGELYKPLRHKIVAQVLEQGYDEASMIEYGVSWADDQDPWGHITNARYPHFVSACNFRLFETFEEHLKDKFEDLMKARGVGVLVRTNTLEMKRPVSYPDAIIVANRLDAVKPDRYHVTTTMWSLRQQAAVAEAHGWVVFFDYSRGKAANLLEYGGVYAELHTRLSEKSVIAAGKRAEWQKRHSARLRPRM